MSGSRQVVTFGKRKTGVEAPPERKAGPHGWPVWIVAGALACLIGAGAVALMAPLLAGNVTTSEAGETARSQQPLTSSSKFLAALDQRPGDLKSYISRGMATCLPESATSSIGVDEVNQVTQNIYLKILTLLSQEVSDEQRQLELKNFVRDAANSIPVDQRDGFRAFMAFDPYGQEAVMCVGSVVRESL